MDSPRQIHRAGIAKSIRQYLRALFLLTLPFCFATAAPQETPQNAEAKLYFFNISGWKAIPEKVTLLDNGKKAVAIHREQYVVVSISPGRHVLQLKDEHPTRGNQRHEIDLDAKPGATYYIAGGYSPSMYTLIWTFSQISKTDADNLQTKMKSNSNN
jgi:hypothetical protein